MRDERSAWTWMTVGCGALALVGLCFAPPAAWFFAMDPPEEDVAPIGRPEVVPVPPALPPPDPNVPVDPNGPRRVSAIVEEVNGVPGLRVGSACEFEVTRETRSDGLFWCNAQIVCGGRLLYGGEEGGQRSGFFDCTLYGAPERHVAGEDPNTTSADGDPAMRLDTLRGTLRIRDDVRGRLGELSVRARVTGVR